MSEDNKEIIKPKPTKKGAKAIVGFLLVVLFVIGFGTYSHMKSSYKQNAAFSDWEGLMFRVSDYLDGVKEHFGFEVEENAYPENPRVIFTNDDVIVPEQEEK